MSAGTCVDLRREIRMTTPPRLPDGARQPQGRKIMQKLLMSAFVAAAASVISAGAFAQTVELKLTHGSPRGHPNNMQADELALNIARATNGRVKITVFG